MDFKNLVLSVLNESPDGVDFEGEYYSYDTGEGDPQTVIIDQILIVPDIENPWVGKTREEINSFPFPFGPVLLCGGFDDLINLPRSQSYDSFSHTNFFHLLGILEYTYKELVEAGFKFYSPNADVQKYFAQIEKKHPKFTIYTKFDIETADPKNLGRFWKIEDKIVLSMWDAAEDHQQSQAFKYVIPFIKQNHPSIKDEQIFVENPMKEGDFASAVSFSGRAPQKVEPYEKEIAELLRQLHLASGDQKKKNEIKEKIKEIAKKYNLDPKKYGISDQVSKSSDYYAQKVLGNSKETVASLKSKMQTSESFVGLNK